MLPTLVSSSCPPAARDPDRLLGTIHQGAPATLVHTTGRFLLGHGTQAGGWTPRLTVVPRLEVGKPSP